MCGVIGVVSNSAANQLLYDGLMVLQHRGQDAAGIVTAEESRFHMHKGQGLARDVFRTRDMRNLLGDMGVAHVRYPTAGSASSSAESQPFYVNSPYGIVLGHNGNLTNTDELKESLFRADLRHVNTNSDSEVLLNVLAHELQVRASGRQLNLDTIFGAVAGVHARCKGAYAVTAFIAGYGLLAFRDPHGIRPLVIGVNEQVAPHEYIVASESVAIDTLGFRLLRDVAPGEAVFVDYQRQLHSRQCSDRAVLNPCIFEYVYLARPDSVMDGVSVYNTRLAMGISLAEKIKRDFAHLNIDVVIPIPDTSRPSALQLANHLNVPYREGFIKNRYIGRTFIQPTDSLRKQGVAMKFLALEENLRGQRVIVIDDSIVRGTTSGPLVRLLRDAGAREVHLRITCPPIAHPCFMGVDMGTYNELVAHRMTLDEIRDHVDCDTLHFLSVEGMMRALGRTGGYCNACFTGVYPLEVDPSQSKTGFERHIA